MNGNAITTDFNFRYIFTGANKAVIKNIICMEFIMQWCVAPADEVCRLTYWQNFKNQNATFLNYGAAAPLAIEDNIGIILLGVYGCK